MRRRQFLMGGLLVAASMLGAVPASALSLGEAKQKGLVGEMSNGYLGVVKSSAQAKKLVDTVNAKRRKAYEDIARKRGATLKDVELLAGKKAINKTPKGQYVKLNGSWRRK